MQIKCNCHMHHGHSPRRVGPFAPRLLHGPVSRRSSIETQQARRTRFSLTFLALSIIHVGRGRSAQRLGGIQ